MSGRCFVGRRLSDESFEHDAECADCFAAVDLPLIVGEVSKVWRTDREREIDGPILCQRFELMIEHNRKRGYRLQSWQMTSTLAEPGVLTETIVAVFAKNDHSNEGGHQ